MDRLSLQGRCRPIAGMHENPAEKLQRRFAHGAGRTGVVLSSAVFALRRRRSSRGRPFFFFFFFFSSASCESKRQFRDLPLLFRGFRAPPSICSNAAAFLFACEGLFLLTCKLGALRAARTSALREALPSVF